MEAFEFQAATQGGVIKIPEKYRKDIAKTVKVIILNEADIDIKKTSAFPYFAVDTTGYKFNRYEANERL